MENANYKLWDLFARNRGYLSPVEALNLFIKCAYEELLQRNEIKERIDINLKAHRFNLEKDTEANFKKELKTYSSSEIRDSLLLMIKLSSINSGRFGNVICPDGICDLTIKLLEINAGDMVMDLGSGNGYFLGKVLDHAKKRKMELKDLHGVEINIDSANVSRMVLSIIGSENFNIIEGNGLEENLALYNKAFTFPPISMRLPELSRREQTSKFGLKFNLRNSLEWVFVDRILSGLTGNNKKAVAVLAPRCLFNEADQEYRDTLLKEGLIEAIIELPVGLLSATAVKTNIILLSENNKKVKVVDASNVLGSDPTRFMHPELPVDEVLKLIENANEISNEELIGAHSLLPSQLLVKQQINDVKGKPLSDSAEVFTGCQYTVKNFEEMFSNEETGYKILTSSDINDGSVEWDKLQNIDYKEEKFDKYAIKKNDLIVTSKSSKVKMCVVDIEPKEKILVTGGMIIVRPDIAKINPTYLKIYLESTNGQLAIKSIQRGATIVTINSKDLSNVIIPEASIEKQNDIAKKYNAKLSTLLALKEELKKVENSLNNLYSEEFDEE